MLLRKISLIPEIGLFIYIGGIKITENDQGQKLRLRVTS